MATKSELVAYGESVGLDVDSSMTKADIEAAFYDAGYDPTNLGEDTMGTEEEQTADEQSTAEDLAGTSSDAQFATYTRPDQQREGEINPPPGPQTVQVRGEPSEGGGTVFSADR